MIPLHIALKEFGLDGEADGLKPATRKWYAAMLKPFAAQHAALRLNEFDHQLLRTYVLEVRRVAKSPTTARDRIVALHRFWTWASKRYHIENPMQGIRRPRPTEPRPKAIEAVDIIAMYKACKRTRAGLRDQTILILLADTGIRAAGLIGLRMEDVNLKKGSLTVLEKGNRRRRVPVSPWTARLLTQWCAIRPDGLFLFSAMNGKPLTYSGLREIIRRLGVAAAIDGRHNIHSFRHFAAREYLNNGGGITQLSKLLGHASIKTTADYYAVFDDTELSSDHGSHSPLKSLFKDSNKDKV